ncbi:MAG: putative quinol monooxygenase [Thermoanaerobaculia bacterium]
MIMFSARIVAHPHERRELVQALLSWAAAVRRDDSAAASHIYEDLEVPAVFAMVTEWKTDAALESHLRSDAFGVLWGALKVLAQPPRLAIMRAKGEHGTDSAEEIRRLRGEPEARR